MNETELTRAERKFRLWMFISAYIYGISGLFFLVAGMRIAPLVNTISEKYLTMLPLYPQPESSPEGTFWLVLSLSLMAMITWICRAAYLDIRRNGRLVHVLLLSKFCSSVFYLFFFFSSHQLVHFVGFATDAPLFLLTLVLWIPAAAGNKYVDETEEDIIVAIGDALLPRGGTFEAGYLDYREECLSDARRMLAELSLMALIAVRAMLRILDSTPVFLSFRFSSFRRLPLEERQNILRRVENHRISGLRSILVAIRIFIVFPFFSREELERSVGFKQAEAK